MSEFKTCAYWSSLLRTLLQNMQHLTYGYYFSGFMKGAKAIQKHDELHKKGFRSIASSKTISLLTTLCFNKEHLFEEVFMQQIVTTFADDRKTVTISLPGFSSRYRIKWPARFLEYRLSMVIAQLSDYEWNQKERIFMPHLEGLEMLTKTVFTEWTLVSTAPENIVLTASFDKPALSVPGSTVIVALGVEVLNGLGEFPSTTNAGTGTMKIVDCFT